MKKPFFLIIFLKVILVFSQTEVNCVTYKVEMAIDQNVSVTNKDLLSIIEGMKSIEFKLYYNKKESLFKKIEKMDKENNRGYNMASRLVSGIYYKNQENQEKIKQVDCFGENVNVLSDYQEYKWLISDETKKINGFLCYKATCEFIEDDKIRNNKKTFHPEVWFTPEIPASFGPRGLDGLPGLVLEGKYNNSSVFIATNISFDCDVDFQIEKPTKGKYLTEIQYQEALVKAYQNSQND